jgi:hypothetical protein
MIERTSVACYNAGAMPETLSLPRTTQAKFLQLADFLAQASRLARELAHGTPDRFPIPDLTPPKVISTEQTWFWSDDWQAGERNVNADLTTGRIAGPFASVEDFFTHLDHQV